ncbi:putative ABC transport system permease protein [Nitrosospira sp. Nsp11]|uniref:ABC transporter permease n=1 Tax=Nitrosospira sp. Nsp11 TaxID=1855338 RepID=UPI000912EE19|nr:FtsX-like permease family protein [Nitrosospira sp. Nsp11]SHL78196.1 putative ABC transport system permease protein [Nitrosospira sp. Nsp11]
MHFLKLISRNTLRHKLRTGLTVLGLVVAILAFGLLRTVVDAWYAGAENASSTRLVTRSSISLVFQLPINYQERIRKIPGVSAISHANWFGGVYITEKNFFPQFAVNEKTYFDLYPEYLIPPAEMKAFRADRKGCVIGRKLADTYGFKVGDTIPLRGTIYPGAWSFTVRAIYDGAEAGTDTSQLFFHWDYLNETLKKTITRRSNHVGVYIIQISDADRAAEISTEIDALFKNSLAETLTETEKAFQLGFVAMTEAIVVAIRIVSFVVIFIILAVMANTMAMTARERIGEYATLKALGFGPRFLTGLIYGESLAIALAGAVIGILLTFPVAHAFSKQVGTLFPVFGVSLETVFMQIAAAIAVGFIAAVMPALRASRVSIVEGLRHIG